MIPMVREDVVILDLLAFGHHNVLPDGIPIVLIQPECVLVVPWELRAVLVAWCRIEGSEFINAFILANPTSCSPWHIGHMQLERWQQQFGVALM